MKYPPGTVRALLDTPHVSDATRAALQARLDAPAYEPQFFDADSYRLLGAVCARLLPQPERGAEAIDLPAGIDARLLSGLADGWRYDALPPDREAYRLGLGGIQQAAQAQFQQDFLALSAEQQDQVLAAVQAGTAPGDLWLKVEARRFFEELLAEATALYYSHPLAQEEIGYVGMADLPAWTRIGLDEREEREPLEVK
ncbi:gluconate 2-dehydrogenase subunit 3 family protein [Hymenobacter jeollabukensis]|uniref:Gluconate 2-dehydrogenase subunit 3 family protein n=1 Tax=Hymenobacter jeollabukensis TaxID=2025313 RepID=A0A5R8WRT9_9BACT|nr:gluconate 2-dehydrogenase subunit 3 family protein [Hymenobacter jeollabukensis]TLM93885.1 gluconate 2-dehydrogenase subunit 3 family protein [Hymenobacter jeollabukensis]